jgi:hypothetical protein
MSSEAPHNGNGSRNGNSRQRKTDQWPYKAREWLPNTLFVLGVVAWFFTSGRQVERLEQGRAQNAATTASLEDRMMKLNEQTISDRARVVGEINGRLDKVATDVSELLRSVGRIEGRLEERKGGS